MNTRLNHLFDLVVYEIYPKSFYDSNGDGIGDLKGIVEKIDHLTELGINAVWLCPCYKSPFADNGYDISDYRAIAEAFGTMEDWERLKNELHARGIKLFMDFVANHTSDEHFWFQEARKSKDNPYRDYYYWVKEPPNDWQSVFGGSAWEYDEQTGEYYLHSFAVKQPDLNWTNEKVRKEMQAVVDFWVEKGVDGFRCDVIDFIAKDFEKGKMYKGEKLHEYIRSLFGRTKTEGLFVVGECQSDKAEAALLCGKDRKELSCVLQFDHTNLGRVDKFTPAPYSFDEIRNVLVEWQNYAQEENIPYVLFTDNHDEGIFISRLGNDKGLRYECATAYATAFFLLRGIPLLYQGQEYGRTNSFHTDFSQFSDVETHNYIAENKDKCKTDALLEKINYGSRDNPRRPFAWTAIPPDSGFGSEKPWLAFHSSAEEINLETDISSEKSVFRFYKKLLKLRRESETLRYGTFKDRTEGRGRFVYERELNGERVFVVVNSGDEKEISEAVEGEIVLCNYADRTDARKVYRPFEAAVYRKGKQ